MRLITKGATSQTVYFDVLDSTSTSGARKTGLAYNTSGLSAYYVRNGASATAITLATQTASGAWSSGGFAEVDSTNMPGVYRLDVPNAAFASGAESVVIGIKGATGMAAARYDVQLTTFDLQTAAAGGGSDPWSTALPGSYTSGEAGYILGTYLTGDAYARLGAPVGASISADIADVPNTVWAKVVETGYTALQMMKLMGAVLVGKVSGLPGSPVFRSADDSANRVTATTDADGNRSAVTLNP